ncbi:hypothetical protein Dimus_035294 [Dionaea muscipula]
MTVIHLKKKDVVKSSVKGISIEFDHERLAAILDVLEELEFVNTSRRYGKSQVIKKGEEPKKYDFFEDTFLTMCKLTRGRWNMVDRKWGRRADDVNTKQTQAVPASSSAQQKDQEPAGVDPSGLTGRDAEFLKFQAEFERKRANRFHDELEKAKAENAKLLALLHKTQTKPHP